MEDIGIFEAKTKFPGLCDQVVRSGSSVLVSRRGKPLVIISPAQTPAAADEGILTRWQEWEATHPDETEADFPEVWKMRENKTRGPLEE